MATTVRTTVVLLFLVAVLLGGMPVYAEVAVGLSISNAFFLQGKADEGVRTSGSAYGFAVSVAGKYFGFDTTGLATVVPIHEYDGADPTGDATYALVGGVSLEPTLYLVSGRSTARPFISAIGRYSTPMLNGRLSNEVPQRVDLGGTVGVTLSLVEQLSLSLRGGLIPSRLTMDSRNSLFQWERDARGYVSMSLSWGI